MGKSTDNKVINQLKVSNELLNPKKKLYENVVKEVKTAYKVHSKLKEEIDWLKNFQKDHNIHNKEDLLNYFSKCPLKEKVELLGKFKNFAKDKGTFTPSKFLASLILNIKNEEYNAKHEIKEKFFILEDNYREADKKIVNSVVDPTTGHTTMTTLLEEGQKVLSEKVLEIVDYVTTNIKEGKPFKLAYIHRDKREASIENNCAHYTAEAIRYDGKTLNFYEIESLGSSEEKEIFKNFYIKLNTALNKNNIDELKEIFKELSKEVGSYENEEDFEKEFSQDMKILIKKSLIENNIQTPINYTGKLLGTQKDGDSCYSFAISHLKHLAEETNEVKKDLIYYKHSQSVSRLEKIKAEKNDPEIKPGVKISEFIENKAPVVLFGLNPLRGEYLVKKVNTSIYDTGLSIYKKTLEKIENESEDKIIERIVNSLSLEKEEVITPETLNIYDKLLAQEIEYYESIHNISCLYRVGLGMDPKEVDDLLMDGRDIVFVNSFISKYPYGTTIPLTIQDIKDQQEWYVKNNTLNEPSEPLNDVTPQLAQIEHDHSIAA
ncbi:MAG: hypothetical protein J0H68_03725 [Sphingobacteriia bacterium]|nr:hypothetical protein [Sphingobacteriia bacterium]